MRCLTVLLLSLLCSNVSAQTTWYVDDDAAGDPGPGDTAISDPLEDGTLAHPFDGIQEALDAGIAGDTIIVADGTYTGAPNRDLDFQGKDMTLQSENGPDNCVIDVELTDYSRGLRFLSGETAACVVQGLTITGGRPRYDNTEAETPGRAHGGGIYCENSSPTIINCIVRDNHNLIEGFELDASLGGALSGAEADGGGLYFLNSQSELIDCTIRDNMPTNLTSLRVLNRNPSGAGLFAIDSDLTLRDCLFENNDTGGGHDGGFGGGAIGLRDSTITMYDCTLRGNRAGDGGLGGTVQSVTGGAGAKGGALGGLQSHVNMHRCVVVGNIAGTGQGNYEESAPGLAGGAGGGIWLQGGTALLVDCLIADNRGGLGGDPAFNLGNNPEAGDGGDGGGIAMNNADATLINTIVAGCRAGKAGVPDATPGRNGQGGALSATGSSTVALINCTITDNSLTLEGASPPEIAGGLYAAGTAQVTLANTILYGNAPQQWDTADAATLAASYSNIQGGLVGAGNIDAMPLFSDPAGPDVDPNTAEDNNYRLPPGAPGNDAGDNTLVPIGTLLDYDQADRFADDPLSPDLCGGLCVDMGAFEANNGAPACDRPVSDPNEDCTGNGIVDACEPDCDGNGTADSCDIASGAADDCNGNGFPDNCELAGGDCDGNGLLDSCEIAAGTSPDCDGNGILDACELAGNDCDGNGVLDACEIADGTADDCNANGIPDACDVAGGLDCDGNGLVDACEIADGTADDCNEDGIPDGCQLSAPLGGSALQFDGNNRLEVGGGGSYMIASGPVTVEAWVYLSDVTGKQTIVQKRGNNYWLWLEDGRIGFGYRSSAFFAYETGPVVADGIWQHVAVVYTFGGEPIDVYLNGQPVAGAWLATPSGAPVADGQRLNVGNNDINTAGLDGLLDEVRIWNVARSQGEIQSASAAFLDPATPGLVAYCRFDEGQGPTTEELIQPFDCSRDGAPWVTLVDCACPDVNGDGVVDLTDLAIVLGNFGSSGMLADGDLTGDGVIDVSDLARVLGGFGQTCP